MDSEQRPADRPSHIPRLLVALVAGVCRRPRLVLAAALATAVAGLVFAAFRLEYRTQRNDLVSANKEAQQRWREYVHEFGDDDDIVVVVQGGDAEQMKASLDALADRIRLKPALFDRLFYKVDLAPLCNRALLFLTAEQIRQIQDNLQSMRMLLDLGPVSWQALSLGSLLAEAKVRLGRLAPGQPLHAADEQFFTQLKAVMASAAQVLRDPQKYQNPWRSLMPETPQTQQQELLTRPQYFFSGDGKLAFLLVRPIKNESSFTSAEKSVAALRSIVNGVKPSFPELAFGLTGLPVLENDEMTASQRDTNLASVLAFTGVALVYFVVFRGFRYPLLTVGTLLVGTAWALGWLTLTVGHLNILSATFAVMLIGMGDYGVLWVTRYDQNRAAGCDVRTALLRTAAGGGPSILTAATATALAFFAAMLADFQAVAELGWIAGGGVLLCALACFTVLPALLLLIDGRKNVGHQPAPMRALRMPQSTAWLPTLSARPRWVLATGLAATLAVGVFASRIAYDHNLLHMQARGLDSVKWELTLIEHTAGASWHALSYRANQDQALALKAEYEKLPGVSRVVEIASLLPRDQDAKIEQLRDIQQRLRNLPSRDAAVAHALPDVHNIRRDLERVLSQLATLRSGATSNLLGANEEEAQALKQQLAATNAAAAVARLHAFDERLSSDLNEDLYRLRDVATPKAIALADLPPSLRERYVGASGAWLLRVFARESLWDFDRLADFVQEIQTVDPEATGKPFSTLEGLQDLKNGFQRATLYALAAIVLVFWADFRRLRYTLLALVPLALGVLFSFGIMGAFGLPLNPANLIGLPLILGVGAVYGVHVVHDYLAHRGASPYTLSYVIGRAVFVMALVNMVSFGTLMIARHVGMASLGFILSLGVTCCMVAALVYLPALLRILSGRGERARLDTIVAASPAHRQRAAYSH